MRKTGIALVLLLATLAIPVATVLADVPAVLSITRRTEGGNTLIDVRVNHNGPTTNHYISQIVLDTDGTIRTFPGLPKATTAQATYTLNIGSSNPASIKAQATCNIHGPSTWFTEASSGGNTGIPAYPVEATAAGVLIAAAAIILAKRQ